MKRKRLLIIENEFSVAKQLKLGLGGQYDITIASGAEQARPLLASAAFPVVTIGLGSDTPREGFKLLEEIPSLAPQTKVIILASKAKEEDAVRAIALGAIDFYAKPIDLKVLKIILARAFRLYGLEQANRCLERRIRQDASLCNMLGVSPGMNKLFERIKLVSRTDYPVLITGESGTGKEMVAHAVHSLSPRASKPMIIINCGAIPENLLESELFGYEKGAFTGALAGRLGRFEQADKGTLFLDEIGALPLALQVKILRFLQEGTVERIGSAKTIRLDVRVVAATNMLLEKAVEQKIFRKDLFYRLNVIPLKIPSLRKRPEDIPILAGHFLREEAKSLGRGQVSFLPAAISAMMAYTWPGNIRQLQNRIRRALSSNPGRVIDSSDLDFDEALPDSKAQRLLTLKQAREAAELKAIRRALALTGNNISRAAGLLETSRPTLHALLKKHGLK